jgi:hypothetical protein
LGDKRGFAMSVSNLESEALRRGDSERAARLSEEGLALTRGLGARGVTAMHLGNLGMAILGQGNPQRATELLAQSMESMYATPSLPTNLCEAGSSSLGYPNEPESKG